MRIDYAILRKLLDCNKSIKLKFVDGSNTLEIVINNLVVNSIKLESNDIEKHCEVIYNTIINLENVTLYIPKIYIKE